MGHLGLTPQGINRLGGYRVQGRSRKEQEKIYKDAELLQSLGVFALVLECIPENVGAAIAQNLHIPVIGIGAGRKCDGQILVINDILGLYNGLLPRFVKQYAHLNKTIHSAVQRYKREVTKGIYPSKKHIYT
ncbi:MAG: 3-methyl-2-oxobutanoate hydroxymethyltransferase [bacterium]